MRSIKDLSIWLCFILIAFTGKSIHADENQAWAKNLNTGMKYTDLQEAINQANSGDTIKIHGTFVGTFTIDYKSLTLKGCGDAVLDGNQGGPVLTIGNSDTVYVELINLTIRNGSGNEEGGGIFMDSANLTLKQVRVVNNSATYGGGIYNNSGTLTIYHSFISDNSASSDGGGLYNYEGTSLTIRGSKISRNTTGGDGAGIYNGWCYTYPTFISGTEISENSTSTGNGGGFYSISSIGSLYEVLIKSNEANNGGGIYNINDSTTLVAELDIKKSSLHKNYASNTGGGAFNGNEDPAALLNFILSEITHNAAGNFGGGILLTGPQEYLQLQVTEVEHNSPDNIEFSEDE